MQQAKRPTRKLKDAGQVIDAISRLSPAQQNMLTFLGPKKESMTINQIAKEMNLHPNSVREIIDALVDHGIVSKRRAKVSGRGRPAWLYEVVVPGSYATFHNHISDLMIATAKTMISENKNPTEKAVALGKTWAHQIVQRLEFDLGNPPFSETTTEAIYRYISRIRLFLSSQGFHAYRGAADNEIQLKACPFLTDDPHTQGIICTMHGAMLAEIVTLLSGNNLTTQLHPFHCDDCCLVAVLKSSSENNA